MSSDQPPINDPMRPVPVKDPTGEEHHHGTRRERLHEIREAIVQGAIEGEKEIGHREETDEEAKQALLKRIGLTIGGFVVIIIGILLLPLPGSGWLVIMAGFSLLPFAWSRKIVREIRKRIPGVPEEGTIPVSTWIIGGVMMVAFTLVSIFWGDDIWSWVKGWFT